MDAGARPEVHASPAECFLSVAREMARRSQAMVAVADRDGRIVVSNAPFRRFFREQLASPRHGLSDLFPPRTLGPTGPQGGWSEPRIVEVKGHLVLVSGFPVQEAGAVRYTGVIAHDVTEVAGKELHQAAEDVATLKRVLDLSIDGLQVVNQDGVLTMVNSSYEEIHGIPRSQAVGRHVTEVIENTRMHVVAQTGVAELDEVQSIHGRLFVVSRIPIYSNGKCVGAVGKIVFQDFGELGRISRKVEAMKKELEALRSDRGKTSVPGVRFSFTDIVANSAQSVHAKERALRTAPLDTTVLLLGESGVGKEVYAHAIHGLSLRCRGPFVRVNCSAIQETLFESELFGYEDGAFTGARKGGKQGKFEAASGGTIFLDEIGDMPLSVQSKLLRALQEKEIEKIGSEKVQRVDVRVIAATNQDLRKLVDEGRFRKDLYYRLNVIPIQVPPLRERTEDIPELVRLFWDGLKTKHGIYHKSLSAEALRFLERYEWPGNIRELHNVLERALTILVEETISEEQIRMIVVGSRETPEECASPEECSLEKLVVQTEKRALSFALARTNNNRLQAARLLGISRALLYKKLHAYGMG